MKTRTGWFVVWLAGGALAGCQSAGETTVRLTVKFDDGVVVDQLKLTLSTTPPDAAGPVTRRSPETAGSPLPDNTKVVARIDEAWGDRTVEFDVFGLANREMSSPGRASVVAQRGRPVPVGPAAGAASVAATPACRRARPGRCSALARRTRGEARSWARRRRPRSGPSLLAARSSPRRRSAAMAPSTSAPKTATSTRLAPERRGSGERPTPAASPVSSA
jgi:hypothetical protein